MTILLGLAFVLIAVAVYLNRRGQSQEQVDEPQACPPFEPEYDGKPDLKPNSEAPDLKQIVKIGAYGGNVVWLQERLNTQYGANLKVDGKAGCDTFYAVQLFTGLDLGEGVDLNDIK